jgi:hypothetical protein
MRNMPKASEIRLEARKQAKTFREMSTAISVKVRCFPFVKTITWRDQRITNENTSPSKI